MQQQADDKLQHKDQSLIIKDIKDISKVYKLYKDAINPFLVFRGVSDSKNKLESGAARRLKTNNVSSQMDFIKYHNVLLDEIHNGHYKGINNENLTDMSELELLAQVQHLGGATCLTDFTTNLLVALWFATNQKVKENNNKKNSDQDQDSDGAVFIVNLHSAYNRENYKDIMTLKDKEKTKLEDILTYQCEDRVMKDHLWYWKPRNTNGRINNQRSVFIFGLPECDDYDKIIIERKSKEKIRKDLKTYFGLDAKTIFPDLQGFSLSANSNSQKLYNLFNLNCLDIARNYLDEGDFEACIHHLNDYKECRVEVKKKDEGCAMHNSPGKCIRKDDNEWKYLEAKSQNLKARNEYQRRKSDSDKKTGYISYENLIKRQKEAADSIMEIIDKIKNDNKNNVKKTKYNHEIKFDWILTLLQCYYDIVIFDENYLSERKDTDNITLNGTEEDRKTYTYADMERTVKQYAKTENKPERKYFLWFALLELSIFAQNKDNYKKYYKLIEKKEIEYINGKMLLRFFKKIGNIVFNLWEIDIKEEPIEKKKRIRAFINKYIDIDDIDQYIVELLKNSISDGKEKYIEALKSLIQKSRTNKDCSDGPLNIYNYNDIEIIREYIVGLPIPMGLDDKQKAIKTMKFVKDMGEEILKYEIGNEINEIENEANRLIKKEIERLKEKEEKDCKIFSFAMHWDYDDMKSWLKHKYEKNMSLIIFCNEMKRMQEDWRDEMFEVAPSYKKDKEGTKS